MKLLLATFLSLGLLAGAATPGACATDERLKEAARLIESSDPALLCETFFCSGWTKAVLQGLSKKERSQLARALGRRTKPEIRGAGSEQFRMSWRDSELPDSEIILSYPIGDRPGDMTRPTLTFSSRVKNIPTLIADALDKNQIPLVQSFHDSLSPWLDQIPKWTPAERRKRAVFYRSLEVSEKGPDEWRLNGPYLSSKGVLVKEEVLLRLYPDGRWQVE